VSLCVFHCAISTSLYRSKPVALDFEGRSIIIPDFRTEFEAFLSDAATTDSLISTPSKKAVSALLRDHSECLSSSRNCLSKSDAEEKLPIPHLNLVGSQPFSIFYQISQSTCPEGNENLPDNQQLETSQFYQNI
jgi:hypothetical protein